MSGVLSAPTNTFSANNAVPAVSILADGHSLWGILEQLAPVGDGLLRVQVSARESLVDESLQGPLAGLMGQSVAICRIAGRWGAGALA